MLLKTLAASPVIVLYHTYIHLIISLWLPFNHSTIHAVVLEEQNLRDNYNTMGIIIYTGNIYLSCCIISDPSFDFFPGLKSFWWLWIPLGEEK